MTARRTSSQSRKSIWGAGVLTLGIFLLFVNLEGLTAEVAGMLPALGLAGWHALQA